jgi:dTDP-4-dehydrorhamnose reductase
VRTLVFGTQGQVGWELERALQPMGEVVALDRAALDLADALHVRQAVLDHRPRWVVNAAAYTQVDQAEDDEAAARRINAEAVEAIATACAKIGATLVHYSTDYVFDGAKEGAYAEEDRPRPLSAYGRTKLQGENAVRHAGCAHAIVRTSWVFSARGRNFLRTILRLAAERDELRIVDDQLGAPTSARFIADATAAILWKAQTVPELAARLDAGEIVHVCSSGTTSWFGFAQYAIAQAALPRKPTLTPIPTSAYPTRAARPRNSALSLERLHMVWGIETPQWQVATDLVLRELGVAAAP